MVHERGTAAALEAAPKLPIEGALRGVRVLERDPPPGSPAAGRTRWLVQLGAESRRREAESAALCAAAQAIGRAAQAVPATVAARLDEVAALAVELGLAVAREIVGAAVQQGLVDPTATVARCLREAVHGVDAAALTVHLHPEDLGPVLDRLEREPALRELAAAARFAADPSLARGAVRAETGAGRMRYDPREAFERVAAAVRSAAAGPDA